MNANDTYMDGHMGYSPVESSVIFSIALSSISLKLPLFHRHSNKIHV